MEKSTFKKSTKQKTKQLEKELAVYKQKSFEIVESKSSNIDFIKFCESNELDSNKLAAVLKSFTINAVEDDVPELVLKWIQDSEICTEKKINKSLDYIKKRDSEVLDEYTDYMDSIAIKKHFHHRNEKKYLRGIRVALAHNKDFYRYLVKKKMLTDYRLNEQKSTKKKSL